MRPRQPCSPRLHLAFLSKPPVSATEAFALPLLGFYSLLLSSERGFPPVGKGMRVKEEANETGEFLGFWVSSISTRHVVQV